jgi:hypothetical protein
MSEGKDGRTGWPGSWAWLDRTLARPFREKVAILALIGFVFYIALILLDNFVLRPYFGDVLGYPEDLTAYRERAQAILDGQVPYRDFHTESPPLIMYLFVIPQALGGNIWIYQLYFCAFSVMTACALYWGLRRFDDRLAFLMGMAYLILPFGIIEFPLGAQDEAITLLFFLLPLLLLLNNKVTASSFAVVLGALSKLFNGLVFPWMIIGAGARKERVTLLLTVIGLGLLLVVPFLILAPDEFLRFPRYYLLGNPDYPTGGSSISPWHFLKQGGLGIPGWGGVAMTLGAVFGSTYLAYRWKLTLWEGSLLVMVSFFLFYPKILFVFFLMPVALILPWALEDRRVMWRILAMALPLFGAVCFSGNGMDPMTDASWAWLVSLALSLLGWILFFQAWWYTRNTRSFIDRKRSL